MKADALGIIYFNHRSITMAKLKILPVKFRVGWKDGNGSPIRDCLGAVDNMNTLRVTGDIL